MFAGYFIRSVTINPLSRGVPTNDYPVEPLTDDRVLRRLYNRSQRMRGFLGLLAIGNVNAGSGKSYKLSFFRITWNPVGQSPTILTVGTPELIFDRESFSLFQRRHVGIETSTQVVGVNILCPAVADFLRHSPAGKIQPGLIEEVVQPIRTGEPQHNRRCIGHCPKTSLILAQLLFNLLALSDVAEDQNDAGCFPLFSLYRCAVVFYRRFEPIL